MVSDSEREAHRSEIVRVAEKLIDDSGGAQAIGATSPLRALADEVEALRSWDRRHPRAVAQ